MNNGKNTSLFVKIQMYFKKIIYFPIVEKLCSTNCLSVLGQIDGTIPSTWEAQELENQKLIDCTDIDLSKMGNCGDFE